MTNNQNKFSVERKLLLVLLLLISPFVAMGEEVLIKDSNSSSVVSCDYKSVTISESGKMEMLLNNYQSCIEKSNTGNNSGNEEKKECLFNNISYSEGDTQTFYKSATDCSNSKLATCGINPFPPNGYAVSDCSEQSISTEGWLVDTLKVGNNITSEDLYGGAGSPETYKVYTIGGGLITAAPGCANNKGLNLCGKASDWLPGARTDEVYAVRNRKDSSAGRSIQFQQNVNGVNIQPSKYDVTISPNPGQMNSSTFDGEGCVRIKNNQDTFRIVLMSDRNYNKYKGNLSASSCYVPKGEKYYINIRATTSGCDFVGQKDPLERKDAKGNVIILGPCNSYYEVH